MLAVVAVEVLEQTALAQYLKLLVVVEAVEVDLYLYVLMVLSILEVAAEIAGH